MTLADLLPSSRNEAWRWSDLSRLPAIAAGGASGAVPETDAFFLGCDGPRLVFVDGVLDESRSDTSGIRIGEVAAQAGDHPLAALAGGRGWEIVLDAGHAPSGPIEIVHATTGGADHLAARIVLGDDAQASVVETYVGNGWANRLTDIRLGKGARLMRAMRLLADGGFTSLVENARLGEGASLVQTVLGAGGADSRIDIRSVLHGIGAYAEAGGTLLARGMQRHDVNVVLHHGAEDGSSRQLWRMAAQDQAVASIAARVEVARGAQRTDAEQSLKGLLMQRTATINLKPELEIFADDVKCAHGATVGELSRDALFYLTARGIDPREARALLTRAFIADALERIGEEPVRDAFKADADRWLGDQA